mmetsp:Transcript_19182/g.35036  ORF Transcript_19182/g.35036 Transcript_19182/m.35036 type:complete len:110 (-) Transcript_19182:941-1270(-)
MNPIGSLEGLASSHSLKWVSFACNRLTDLDALPLLPSLEYLSLFGNYLGDGDSNEARLDYIASILQERCPGLQHLFLMGNGFDALPCYTDKLSAVGLVKLDGNSLARSS